MIQIEGQAIVSDTGLIETEDDDLLTTEDEVYLAQE